MEEGRTLFRGHKGDIESVEFCGESGNLALSASGADGSCRIWDLRLGRTVQCLGKLGKLTHAIWRGEDAIYTCEETGVVSRLDTRGTAVVKKGVDCVLWSVSVGNEVVNQLDMSANGTTLLACDDGGSVHALESATGRSLVSKVLLTSLVTSISCRPNSTEVVAVGTDCAVRVWSYQGGAAATPPKAFVVTADAGDGSSSTQMLNPPHVHHVKCHPKGRYAAAALGDGRCLLFDLNTRKPLDYLSGAHTYSLSHVSFPTERLLVTAGNDKLCVVWSVDARKCKGAAARHKWKLPEKPNWTATHSTGSVLFAMGENIAKLKIPP